MGVDKLEGSEMALCQLSGFQFLHLPEFTFLFQLLRSLLFVPTEVQMVASGNKILQDICVLPVTSSSRSGAVGGGLGILDWTKRFVLEKCLYHHSR